MKPYRRLYGLRLKNSVELLSFMASANPDAEELFAISVEFSLEAPDDTVWLVDSWEKANRARMPTEWYNASYFTPNHTFNPDELEVVEVNLYLL